MASKKTDVLSIQLLARIKNRLYSIIAIYLLLFSDPSLGYCQMRETQIIPITDRVAEAYSQDEV